MCEQCGAKTRGSDLCGPCEFRQIEHDQPGYGLAPSTFGFLSDTE